MFEGEFSLPLKGFVLIYINVSHQLGESYNPLLKQTKMLTNIGQKFIKMYTQKTRFSISVKLGFKLLLIINPCLWHGP